VLWDTGAQVSRILSGQLRDDIKTDSESGVVQTEGYATAKVRCAHSDGFVKVTGLIFSLLRFTGVLLEIETSIAFRPTMPNNTTFIILGQHVSDVLPRCNGIRTSGTSGLYSISNDAGCYYSRTLGEYRSIRTDRVSHSPHQFIQIHVFTV